ncbi:MAG: NUDIX domain-containing protein [bacterium]|nr:NUDIX domain-containing protein [bacterium]MDZ4296404.1 NUDIX domain-containing protein [Patescibacteria group bacterium]
MVEQSAGIVVFYRGVKRLEYLLIQHDPEDLRRKRGREVAGEYWNLPKGHIEAGETLEATALRELAEETGITRVTLVPGFRESERYRFVSPAGERIVKRVTWFAAESPTKEVVLSPEHINFVWLPYADACAKATYPYTRRLIRKVQRFLHQQYLQAHENTRTTPTPYAL